jgi:hypothetical protein
MIVSLNEIEVTVANAAIGAGAPIGLAEDAGAAAAWLASRGFPVAPVIRAALDGLLSGTSGPPEFSRDGRGGRETSAKSRVSAVLAGSIACDLLLAAPGRDRPAIRFGAIDGRLLAAASAALAAKRHGASFAVSWQEGVASVQFVSWSETTFVHADDMAVFQQPQVGPLTIERPAAGDKVPNDWHGAVIGPHEFAKTRSHVLDHGVTLDEADWAWIRTLAARMLVPASERSRAVGAGAGLIDTD